MHENPSRLGECPVCRRGHRVVPQKIEPSSKPNTVVCYYVCECGWRFIKWFSESNLDKAAKAIEEAHLPYRRYRRTRGPYGKTARKSNTDETTEEA